MGRGLGAASLSFSLFFLSAIARDSPVSAGNGFARVCFSEPLCDCSEMASDEGKLFVGGLSFDTNEQNLEQLFSPYGDIAEVVVVKDRETQRSRGFGFITYCRPEDAKDAMRAMNGESVDGRQIRVDQAGKSSRGSSGGRGRGRGFSRGGGYGAGRYDSRSGGYGGSRDYYGSRNQGGYGDRYSGGSYRDNYDN